MEAESIRMADPTAVKGQRGAEIYSVLKQRIVHWEYPPGRRLIEDELCQEFGVSRVPVREALSMLEEKNLVEKLPFRGCSVKQPDLTEINELYDVRLALELFGVTRLATSGMNEQEWQELYTLWTASIPDMAAQAGSGLNGYELAHHDESFHERLAKATGNKTLWEQLRLIDERLFVVRVTDITSLERLQETGASGMKIVKIDVDEDPGLQQKFGIRSLPTLIIMYKGGEFARHEGSIKEEKLGPWVASAATAIQSVK